MTRRQAVEWLLSINGGLDFDGQYGNQCVDYFNFYYQHITGRNPYSDGYGVEGAKDLWNVPTDLFDKIANDASNADQLPQGGDILVYNSKWGHGYGHVEMVLSADKDSVTVSAQNSLGQYVATERRLWGNIVGGLIGWMSYKGFTSSTPVSKEVITVRPANLWNLNAQTWADFTPYSTYPTDTILKTRGTYAHSLGGIYYLIEGQPDYAGVNMVDVQDYTAPVIPEPPVVVPPVEPPIVPEPPVTPPVEPPVVPEPPIEPPTKPSIIDRVIKVIVMIWSIIVKGQKTW